MASEIKTTVICVECGQRHPICESYLSRTHTPVWRGLRHIEQARTAKLLLEGTMDRAISGLNLR